MATLTRQAPRERSKIREIFTDKSAGPPYTVYADTQLTRRKRHHIITDNTAGVVFRSRWWTDIIEWLAREQQETYTVVTDREAYGVTSRRLRN